MQTVSPTNSVARIVTANAVLAPEGTPISGVIIDILDVATLTPLASAVTNAEGSAILPLNNTPAVGQNVIAQARRGGQEQRISALVCNDTTITFIFTAQAPATATCLRLNGADSLRFRNNTIPSSDTLVQNEPLGINQYSSCWSFINNGNDTILLPLTNQFREILPFALSSISVNGRNVSVSADTVRIPPLGSLSLCFSVSTLIAGDFSQNLSLRLFCTSGEQGIFRLRLRAFVIERTCRCVSSELTVSASSRTPLGSTQELANIVVYTNQLSCPVTATILGIRTLSGSPQTQWSLLQPARGSAQIIAPGASLQASVRFSPSTIQTAPEQLLLEIRPQESQQVCTVAVRLSGQACRNECPALQTRTTAVPFVQLPNMPTTVSESFSTRLDGNVFVSLPELGMATSLSRTYAVINPSTSCSVVETNITPVFLDQYSSRFYSVSPRTLRIAPGETAFFQVSFTPPDAMMFASILQDPSRQTGTAADSSFSVTLEINSGSCAQRLAISAKVTNIPDISPILNLRAYRQRTRLKPQEENEVYIFGEESRRILRQSSGLSGIFPPPIGDIYADVMNNSPDANPPQFPTLHIVPNGRVTGIALWRENYAEQDFDNVIQTLRSYLASPVTSFGANQVQPAPGQAYAFRLRGGVALLYVRRVDNGLEQNTNGQSGIEFRAIYPILGQ